MPRPPALPHAMLIIQNDLGFVQKCGETEEDTIKRSKSKCKKKKGGAKKKRVCQCTAVAQRRHGSKYNNFYIIIFPISNAPLNEDRSNPADRQIGRLMFSSP
jgi:hypothetical protein